MSTGHYGPLIFAWRGKCPTPGQLIELVWKGADKEQAPNRLLCIREATREEYEECCREREIDPAPAAGRKYFEVHTD